MDNGIAPNAKRLLWAGFAAIFASGVGFSVRTGVLGDWASNYGFTMSELGGITGGGLWGFGIIIILFSLIADRIGYGRLMGFAFSMHVLSAILQLATGYVFEHFGKNWTYWNLVVAMVLFSIGNGVCEAVVNPMTATLFPRQKTHYLNMLHAGWPGGLIAGGLASYFMNGGAIGTWAPIGKVHWMVQMSLFLVPVAVYGLMLLGERMPVSEAGEAGIDFWTMLAQFAAPLLIFLLFIHALVGYVELGTDSWISKITGTIMSSPTNGLLLFVYTSALMFALRFFAGPILHRFRISPLGLLLCSATLACIGLSLLGHVGTALLCVVAATVYGCGKTFFWPTMLAVASERFPKGGALVIGAMGGVGMLSAGLLGGPAIGFQQDVYASSYLKQKAPETYDRYAAPEVNSFYGIWTVKGLDGTKVGVLDLATQAQKAATEGKTEAVHEDQRQIELSLEQAKPPLTDWWRTEAEPNVEHDAGPVGLANLIGGQTALRWTAVVPATMAFCYLLLLLYFWA
ncbi:MAG TPA: MFS transporter, partial [Gemmataceae bacterium]|nr:MFS transporter [Gemmataceae bacterium]